MIATSTTTPVEWRPVWVKTDPPCFLFTAPSVLERMNFEAMLASEHRAGRMYGFEFAAAFDAGVDALLGDTPDEAAQIKELAAAERSLEPGETLAPDELAALAQVRETLAESWPDYRNLLAQGERRHAVLPVLAFRRFCVGWEGEGLPPFRRGLDGQVALAALEGVAAYGASGSMLIHVAGTFAYNLSSGRGQEKNSEPPSHADGNPTPSPSPTVPTDGTSAETSGT